MRLIISLEEKSFSNEIIVLSVPRAKPDQFCRGNCLQFRVAISNAVAACNLENRRKIINGSFGIIRKIPTMTTHLKNAYNAWNIGSAPYKGITADTCELVVDIKGRDVLLIDDIYTQDAGIDEDCIQFLLDNGAENILFYALGATARFAK